MAVGPCWYWPRHVRKKDPGGGTAGNVQLIRAKVGTVYLDLQSTVGDIPVDKNAVIEFSNVLDTAIVQEKASCLKRTVAHC
ncbi:MAG: hypothetical protein MZV63_69020 [Marinilabiliales bacterium]|nr:hypothetical protein [Marinilabiliales bacterium]